MYSNEVLNSASSVNFYCPLHLFFQHPNSLPNSLDPSASKLSVYCVDPIFHHYKTSYTTTTALPKATVFMMQAWKSPNHSHSRAAKGVWLRKQHLGESHFESGNTNIRYAPVDAFRPDSISASPWNLSFSSFVLLCLQVLSAWLHSQLIILLILLKKTCALPIPSSGKAFTIRYMQSFSFHSFRHLFKFFGWAYSNAFISFIFVMISWKWTIFSFNPYKQCMFVSILENLPIQYLTKLCILHYSWIAGLWDMGWLKVAR